MMPKRIAKDIKKSISQEIITDKGNTSLGKYIFVIRLGFATKLVVASFKALAKNDHGRSPQYTNMG